MTTTALAIVIELPLPPMALSSNGSHGHWSTKSGTAKAYRFACHIAARATPRMRGLELEQERRRVSYTFGIKGARAGGYYCPRDVSNALAAFKAGQDGLVDAGILVDDSKRWMELGTVTIDATVGPFVRVTVEPCDS